MGKRAPTIGTLLALSFLSSLLAMALVGGGGLATSSLAPIEPLPREAHGPPLRVSAAPGEPGARSPSPPGSRIEASEAPERLGPPPAESGADGSEDDEAIEVGPVEGGDSGGEDGESEDAQDDVPQSGAHVEGASVSSGKDKAKVKEEGHKNTKGQGHCKGNGVGHENDECGSTDAGADEPADASEASGSDPKKPPGHQQGKDKVKGKPK